MTETGEIAAPTAEVALPEQLAMFSAARGVAAAFASPVPLDASDVAARVELLLEQMQASGLKAELPLQSFVTGNLLARQLSMPAGTFAIGEIQRFGHVSVLLSGEISMLNETGGITRLVAPATFPSKPGVRKVGFVHKDVVWTTVHDMSGYDGDLLSATPKQLEAYIATNSMQEWQASVGHTKSTEDQQ